MSRHARTLIAAAAITLAAGVANAAAWGPYCADAYQGGVNHTPLVAPQAPFQWGHFGAGDYAARAGWHRGYTGTLVRWNQYRQY